MKKILIILALVMAIGLFAEDVFPTFSLENIKGDTIDLEDHLEDGKLVIIDFWATWCKPCMKELPELDKIDKEYDDVSVIAISIDRPRHVNKVKRVIRSKNFGFITLLDSDKMLQRELNLKNVPRTLIINSQRQILYDHSGFKIGDEVKLKKKLDSFLQPQTEKEMQKETEK
jgi:thiol-disulfide isomerase/thioredoxin